MLTFFFFFFFKWVSAQVIGLGIQWDEIKSVKIYPGIKAVKLNFILPLGLGVNLILISALADICQHHALIRVEEAEWRKFFDPFDPFGDFLCMVFVYACPYVCIPSSTSPSTLHPCPTTGKLSFFHCMSLHTTGLHCQSLNAQHSRQSGLCLGMAFLLFRVAGGWTWRKLKSVVSPVIAALLLWSPQQGEKDLEVEPRGQVSSFQVRPTYLQREALWGLK